MITIPKPKGDLFGIGYDPLVENPDLAAFRLGERLLHVIQCILLMECVHTYIHTYMLHACMQLIVVSDSYHIIAHTPCHILTPDLVFLFSPSGQGSSSSSSGQGVYRMDVAGRGGTQNGMPIAEQLLQQVKKRGLQSGFGGNDEDDEVYDDTSEGHTTHLGSRSGLGSGLGSRSRHMETDVGSDDDDNGTTDSLTYTLS